MKILFTLCIFGMLFTSCKGQQEKSATGEQFGKAITADNAIAFDNLMQLMEKQDTVKTKLKAKVTSVCQVKGCWMNLVDTNNEAGSSLFVKFKDYGFFMPLDLSGKEVVVEGMAYKEVTSVDELRHYAEDEGKSKEEIAKITEPVEELKFMADGVIVL